MVVPATLTSLVAIIWAATLVAAAGQASARSPDGAEMVLVPGGEFWMGSTVEEVKRLVEECKREAKEQQCKEWNENELPRHRVVLDAFYIDRYEVTTALFERFVKATGHRTTAEREGGFVIYAEKDGTLKVRQTDGATWRAPNGPGSGAEPNHPVMQVAWSDADAYCQWVGKRLPTEAEWEKAARGTDGRRYPWGDDWDSSRANGERRLGKTAPVGAHPRGASPYGVHDMAGNVWEWVADWYDAGYYRRSPERNPTGPGSGRERVIRGGSWLKPPDSLRTATRAPFAPERRYNYLGFRCAKASR